MVCSEVVVKNSLSVREVGCGLPRGVRVGITGPFDEVMPFVSHDFVFENGFHFMFGFSIYNVGWWSFKVGTIGCRFVIGKEKFCVEDGVNVSPFPWKFEFVGDWSEDVYNRVRSFVFQ